MATDESPIPHLKDRDLFREQAFIGGAWTDAGGAGLEVTDPADGRVLGTVPACGVDETEAAVEAAARALPAWRATPAAERGLVLEEWHRLITASQNDLARIMTAEQGKPLTEARAEIAYAASFVKWFAGEAPRIGGREVAASTADRRVLVRREPVGVCAAITPWNFPAAMITRKLAPALAAGCTMVVKPASQTPFTALALASLAQRAGVPKGALGVVTGSAGPIGEVLTGSATVRMLSFTGSTGVGAKLMAQCAPTVKKLGLELGGNAPFIIFDDADLDLAVEGVMHAKFRNAGQSCVGANRILVQAGIHDALVERLAARISALTVGRGDREGTEVGPLIDDEARSKVGEHVEDALGKGGKLVAEAKVPGERFTAPMLLTGADPSMRLADEETFGPLAALFRFEREEEAIAMANATPFGLASYFYTDDLHRAWRVGEALEFGMVGLNTGSVSMAQAPFGGIKLSGLGREGGEEGMDEFLETKAFHWGGLKGG